MRTKPRSKGRLPARLTLHFRTRFALVVAGVLTLIVAGCAEPETMRPNFVLILADDLGWHDVGFMGERFYETPNLDRLASEGMIFPEAYANGPNCAPTRASLLSGQYSPRTGVYTVGSAERGESSARHLIPESNRTELESPFVTLAEALQQAGYATGHIGKWHLGEAGTGPLEQGFLVNRGGNSSGSPSSYFSPYRNPDLPDGADGEYLTDRLTEEALRFLDDNSHRPFFLYLAHYAVHRPIQGKPEITARYRQKRGDFATENSELPNSEYAAMIESLDASVGRVAEKLVELDLDEQTLLIFFSDNGGLLGVTDNLPLRGGKGMLYEGGIREPMFARWPGRIEPGSVCREPIMGVDFYPTYLELSGQPLPNSPVLDGQSLVPLLLKTDGWQPRPLFWHFPAYLEGDEHNSIGSHRTGWRTTPCAAVRMGDWKLIEYYEDGSLELFNLSQDIGEKRNLADSERSQREILHGLLRGWQASVRAPIPTRRNPEFQQD